MALDPETIFSPAGQDTREKAKQITGRKQQSHIDGRLGLVIDGTGKDVAKYSKTKKMLEDLGYETMMLFVNTSEEVAQERNLQRPRQLDPAVVKKMWNNVQQNIMAFQQLFGASNFYVVDNSGGLEDPSRAKNFNEVRKALDRFIETPPRMPAAKKWLDAQKPKQESVTEDREVTQTDLQKLEYYADKVFATVGIDVEFTRHFLDRVNDERNVRQITLPELAVLFRDEYKKWGKKIAQLGPDSEAVMKDMRSDINIPFALVWDNRNQELDLVAKTVMRKKNFKTPNHEFPVESQANEDIGNIPDWQTIVAIAAAAKMTPLAIKALWKTAKGAYKVKKFASRAGIKIADKVVGESAIADQLKGQDNIPAKVKPNLTKGSQKHPHRGKLVGGV